jgi:hypothetical protein
MCKRGCWQSHESSQSFLAPRWPNLGSCLGSVGLPCAHEERVVGSIRGDPGLVELPEPGPVSAGSALPGFPAPEVEVEHRELVPASSEAVLHVCSRAYWSVDRLEGFHPSTYPDVTQCQYRYISVHAGIS